VGAGGTHALHTLIVSRSRREYRLLRSPNVARLRPVRMTSRVIQLISSLMALTPPAARSKSRDSRRPRAVVAGVARGQYGAVATAQCPPTPRSDIAFGLVMPRALGVYTDLGAAPDSIATPFLTFSTMPPFFYALKFLCYPRHLIAELRLLYACEI